MKSLCRGNRFATCKVWRKILEPVGAQMIAALRELRQARVADPFIVTSGPLQLRMVDQQALMAQLLSI